MANPRLPESLPGPEVDSMSWKPQENRIRTTMEGAGLPKTRRRFTAIPEDVTCVLYLNADQLKVLLDFHDLDLATVLPFEWHEFRRPGDGEYSAAYRFKRRPEHVAWGHDKWQVQLELELIPAGILAGMAGAA